MTSQIVEEQIKLLDEKLEELFNLAGFAILAFIRGDVTQDEREALLSDWNEEAQAHYRSFAHSIIESVKKEVGEKVIGEDVPVQIGMDINITNMYYNELRAKQRIALEKIGEGK